MILKLWNIHYFLKLLSLSRFSPISPPGFMNKHDSANDYQIDFFNPTTFHLVTGFSWPPLYLSLIPGLVYQKAECGRLL
jgi:hypothetical protein